MPAHLAYPLKNFHASGLLMKWNEITDTLVTRGHAADIRTGELTGPTAQ